jgi:hypothetical protein
VAVDAGDGCVEPAAATALDGSYPMSRELLLYVSEEAHARSGAVAAFVALLVAADDGLAEQVQMVPPTPQQRAAAQDALELLGAGPG